MHKRRNFSFMPWHPIVGMDGTENPRNPVRLRNLALQNMLRSASGLSHPTFYRITPVRIRDGVLTFGPLIQLVECLLCTQNVMGSILIGSTKIFRRCRITGSVHRPFKSEIRVRVPTALLKYMGSHDPRRRAGFASRLRWIRFPPDPRKSTGGVITVGKA